jgi:hypothetical protein
MKQELHEPETNNMNKYIRNLQEDRNEFKKGFQLKTNLAKDENGD